MRAIARFVRDVVALGAFAARLGLLFLLGMALPLGLIGAWCEAHRDGRGVDEPLHTAGVVLFALVGLVWYDRVRNWFFPGPDTTQWETPPWDR
jgi:hypothetical protein